MLKTTATVEEIGEEIADFLSSRIKVDRLIVFGSYAYGRPRKDSDLDMAVISEDLSKMDIWERIKLFAQAALAVDSRVELKGFTPREFRSPERGSLLEMIKMRGKIIWKTTRATLRAS